MVPSTRYRVLGTKYLVPGTWHQVLGAKYLVPSTWYQVLGTEYLLPSTWYQVLGTKYLVPSTWYHVLGTKYLVPGTWYQVPAIWTKFKQQIPFSKIWPILCHPALKMLRISPRSFLAWFWSLLFLTFFLSLDFPGGFPQKGALGKVGASAGGGGA